MPDEGQELLKQLQPLNLDGLKEIKRLLQNSGLALPKSINHSLMEYPRRPIHLLYLNYAPLHGAQISQ